MSIIVALTLLSFAVTFILIALSIYHLAKTIAHIRSHKSFLANLISPLSLFDSSFFDDTGNFHRKRFGIFLILALFILLCTSLFGLS